MDITAKGYRLQAFINILCRVLARSCRHLISWGCQRLCGGMWQTHCHCGWLFGRLQQPDLYIIVSSCSHSTDSTTVTVI